MVVLIGYLEASTTVHKGQGCKRRINLELANNGVFL